MIRCSIELLQSEFKSIKHVRNLLLPEICGEAQALQFLLWHAIAHETALDEWSKMARFPSSVGALQRHGLARTRFE